VNPVAVIGYGAVSALGRGPEAVRAGAPGQPAPRGIQRDEGLERAGLRRPFAARARLGGSEGSERAEALLAAASAQIAQAIEQVLPDFRSLRIGLAIGTSCGGLESQRLAFERIDTGGPLDGALARRANYFAPAGRLPDLLRVTPTLTTNVLAACASSTVAIGVGCRWLQAGHVDLVIAGGYDALDPFVAAGFEALGATTASHPSPFRRDRDGMALGEGAALLALVSEPPPRARALGWVTGFSASADAVHVTAPDRSGRGLAEASRAALHDAGLRASEIDLVSAHATATAFNDAAELRALESVFGVHQERLVLHPFKASIGHTLGAAGALETLSALDAMERGVLPAAAGDGPLDPGCQSRLLPSAVPAPIGHCLKLSAAFGGANAALVVSRTPRPQRTAPRLDAVGLRAVGRPVSRFCLDAALPHLRCPPEKVARLDALSELVTAAAIDLAPELAALAGARAGVIVGTVAATLEENASFERRRRERGAARVEPRRFPATSPNLASGQCAIALGLRGPGFSVGGGPAAGLEALLLAFDLLQAGDAEALLVVAADPVGSVVESLFGAAGWPVPAHGAAALLLERGGVGRRLARGELAERLATCAAAQGRLGEARPGWPSLLEAVATS